MSGAIEQTGLREGYKEVQIGPKSFEIPEEWEVKTIPDLCNLSTESFDPSNHSEPTFEYIDIESVSQGTIDQSKTIPVEDAPSRAKQIVSAGDTLVGKVRPYLQAFAPVTDEHDGKVCSTGFAVLSAKEDVCSSYITQAILSKYFLDQMTNRMTGTSYPAVNKSDFENVQLFAPPLHEQRRIADILSTVDEQIRQTDEIIEEFEELKKGIAQLLLDKGARSESKKEVVIGPLSVPLPESWELRRLENFPSPTSSVVQTGPYGSKLQKEEFTDSGYKIYRQANINSGDFEKGDQYVTEAKYRDLEKYQVAPGDVLLTRMGTIGDAAVLPDNARNGIMDYHLFRIRIDPSFCLPEYLSEVLQSSRIVKHQIESFSHGAIMDGLNTGLINELRIPVPPTEEQREIVDILSTIDQTVAIEKERKTELKQLKRGLMQDLLTGKVRVNTD